MEHVPVVREVKALQAVDQLAGCRLMEGPLVVDRLGLLLVVQLATLHLVPH